LEQILSNSEVIILMKVGVSMLFGALLGFEREDADKPAGLRTHILVAGGSTLFFSLGLLAVKEFTVEYPNDVIASDPIRVLQAIITGVSFLGAGTIIRQRRKGAVEGLTTAASVFLACGIGISVSLEKWLIAIGSTILALAVLRGIPFRFFEYNT
jgi:putative Mg2+ transporter-C (MgtC) family protein